MVTEKQVVDFCKALAEQPTLTVGNLYSDGSFDFFDKDDYSHGDGEPKEIIYSLSKRYNDTFDNIYHRFYAR